MHPTPGDVVEHFAGDLYRVGRVWHVIGRRTPLLSSLELEPLAGGERVRVTRREFRRDWRPWGPLPGGSDA